MEVTGFQLKEAIKMHTLELETVRSQFDESLYKFEGEDKRTPAEVASHIHELEDKVAKLQAAQEYYNQHVFVDVQGIDVPLVVAIKRVGGAGRLAKMWKEAARGNKRDRWAARQTVTRRTDEVVAQSTITKEDALKAAKEAERYAAALRSAIAVGNTKKVSVYLVDEKLLG